MENLIFCTVYIRPFSEHQALKDKARGKDGKFRLETGSRPSYDFHKIPILEDLLMFSSWYLSLLFAPVHSFKGMKSWKIDILG